MCNGYSISSMEGNNGDVMQYLIRRTIQADLPEILELIHEFHGEILNELGAFCQDDVANELMPKMVHTSMVLDIDGKIVGVIAGFITNHIVSKDPLMQEVLWFVSKEYRKYGLKLYREFVQMCKERGIKQLVMGNMGNTKNKTFERFYESEGFRILDIQYIKKL